jgi:hypothetical protein
MGKSDRIEQTRGITYGAIGESCRFYCTMCAITLVRNIFILIIVDSIALIKLQFIILETCSMSIFQI